MEPGSEALGQALKAAEVPALRTAGGGGEAASGAGGDASSTADLSVEDLGGVPLLVDVRCPAEDLCRRVLAAASADEQTPADLGSLRMHIVRPTSGGVHFFEAVPRHEETGTVLLEGGALEALGKLPLKESLGAIGHDCTIVAWNGKDVGGFKVVPGEAGQAISLQCSYVKPDASGAPDSTPFELTLSRSATLTELVSRSMTTISPLADSFLCSVFSSTEVFKG